MENIINNPIVLSVLFITGFILLCKSIYIIYASYILNPSSEIKEISTNMIRNNADIENVYHRNFHNLLKDSVGLKNTEDNSNAKYKHEKGIQFTEDNKVILCSGKNAIARVKYISQQKVHGGGWGI
ncbi:hypothetical protein L5F32_06745 [Aliarcobacter butzleri]|uniref:hypothetical protein n=1 Tax=Aliarcobacter butzleri TaxID=28197 RepID=UPI001EDC54C2|nr:hypothetical protein [Aliarcobacter butzleri]MCG3651967.1 hypothetical protein [Aliarcobacter butzleri]